jgi:hypothetical protein
LLGRLSVEPCAELCDASKLRDFADNSANAENSAVPTMLLARFFNNLQMVSELRYLSAVAQ